MKTIKKSHLLVVLLMVLPSVPSVVYGKTLYYVPVEERRIIQSKYVSDKFEIEIAQPVRKKGDTERFPVLYTTDADMLFDALKLMSNHLQVPYGLVPRFILVGIGYPGENWLVGRGIRRRDFSFYKPNNYPWPSHIEIEGVRIMTKAEKRAGADQFLKFIREELIPMIDLNYPTISGDRAYYGYSRGAGFGLYTLFNKPDTFNRYIISSPSIANKQAKLTAINMARKFSQSADGGIQLYMSVGEKEGWVLEDFHQFAEILRNKQKLDLTTEIIANESHFTVWPMAFVHGVQAVFGPSERRVFDKK